MSDDIDLNQFKEIFVSEAKEHLAALNAYLLELEKDPRNLDIVNGIFRAAHTLKGMAATMGYQKTTELTHKMENVLDKMRSKKLEVQTGSVDLLFDCLDVLEQLVDEVVTGCDKQIAIDGLIEKLLALDAQATPAAPPSVPAAVPPQSIVPPSPAMPVPVPPPPISSQPAMPTVPAAPAPVPPPPPPAPAASQIHKPAALSTAPAAAAVEPSCAAAVQAPVKETSAKVQTTIRVKVEHLDKLMNLVGELVITKARLVQIAAKERIPELTAVINEINQNTTDLQEEVLRTRMVAVKNIFDRYPRMVRDLSHRSKKEIEFVMNGTEIEIDRMLLEQINDPLVHLLRNAVDHGVENPEDRVKAGKPAGGTVNLTSRREKGYVWIEVADDGKGIDVEEIRQKAVEKSLVSQIDAQQMNDNEVLMLICEPGFSTAREITDISGRGVGMDVVKHLVEAFNGRLVIDSQKGKGTKFTLQLPLTLAIIQALLVKVGSETYAIPLTNVSETAKIDLEQVKTIENRNVLFLRNEVIPLVRLSDIFNTPTTTRGDTFPNAVIVENNQQKLGLVVDDLVGKREIVIKTLTGMLKAAKNFSGATILGDGRVVLIIDITSL
jgi:two-component system chemotaxis sensor kinase CheA